METVDLKQFDKTLYTASATSVQCIDVPPRPYLMVDGGGDPNTSVAYKERVAALFTLAYGLRAAIKSAASTAYTVMPLEGLWWVRAGESFSYADKSNWEWTLLIRQPDSVNDALLSEVKSAALRKKGLPALHDVRLEIFREGLALQILHIGPFSTEPATVALLDAYGSEHGYAMSGKHHEIYLNDFQRVAPEKLRTIIRHPVKLAKLG